MSEKLSIDYVETIFYTFVIGLSLFFIGYVAVRSHHIGYENAKQDIQKQLIEQGIMEYDSKTGQIVFVGEENGL